MPLLAYINIITDRFISESNINLVNDTMLKNIDIIDESYDINDFLNCNERIQDMQFFKKCNYIFDTSFKIINYILFVQFNFRTILT